MKIIKLNEIIDANDDLIGANDIPTNGSDLESQANNTTDYNQKVGTQPFRYDMMGRFGFTLLPFMEGVDKNKEQTELENELIELMHERYIDILSYYFRNPQRIKSDYRKHVTDDENSEEAKKHDIKFASKIIKVIQSHFENAFKESETLDETIIDEDTMVDKIDKEFSVKSNDSDIQDAKLKKIAGLINKLDADKKKKIKNLLENE